MTSFTLLGLLLVLLLLRFKGLLAWQDYKDYKVFEVKPHDDIKLRMLHQLAREKAHWDLLAPRRNYNESGLRVLVSPSQVDGLLELLKTHSIEHQLLLDDLSPLVEAQRAENQRSKSLNPSPRLDVLGGFYTHAEINEYLDSLPERYPQHAFVKQFGWSYERRPLKLLTIHNGDGRSNKPVIFIDAAMHAREWIAPSLALYIIQQLLDNYAENKQLLQDYDWIIMPVVNADGYEFSHTDSRYWRKTRKPTWDPENIGTDLNRNFGYEWGHDEGSSPDPAEEIYRGEHAFDQPESQVVRDILLHYSDRLTFYLSLHSYGNFFLLPWGHTSDLPKNYNDMMEVADAGALAIVQATNEIYSYGSGYHLMYPTSGDSTDYAVAVANATVAITMELPAGGFLGFDPWVSHIEGIVTESWIGVRAMAMEVIRRYQPES
ncbi:carboxypeptidase B [Drosophila grimshawi]|uniref:GH14881 n=1 Tax=Drosophila grimshawi TaxID=7222 RepID=B4J2G6_DROGR|nr:carboxypeptidase B [Drosophila grimshawi]EDV97051.1 GH14881 [Drosophila grimshawi]